MSVSSYRTILRSSSIIGGAQILNIFARLLKMKAAAVLLGPAGVGLVGLYLNLIQAASQVAALGLNNAGTRQVAAANADGGDIAVGRTRRALFWGTFVLAIAGALIFWLASERIAAFVLDDPTRTADVRWLALGVALTVAAGSQTALLTGMRRVGDLARVQLGAGILGTILGVGALWLWGSDGLIAMVLIGPAATFLLGHLYVMRLGRAAGERLRPAELGAEWKIMVSLGIAFMLSGLIGTLGHLGARTLVQRELGVEALGQFQAAWAIGMTYLGVVLGAMGTDYYPRLTAALRDRGAATRLVNEQTEVALLLCAPLLVAMLGFAPWVIRILYTEGFEPAVDILRWQLLGDMLKVMSWPLGFVLVAAGAGKTVIMAEGFGMAVLLAGIWIGMPLVGLTATGIAFLALYIAYLPLVRWLAGRMIGFRWSRAVKLQALAVGAAAIAVDLTGRWSDPWGAALGFVLASALGIFAMIRLASVAELGSHRRLAPLVRLAERLRGWTRKLT